MTADNLLYSPLPIHLEAISPDDPTHVAELTRQRLLCGWGLHDIPRWLDMIRSGDRLMYWIFESMGNSADAERLALDVVVPTQDVSPDALAALPPLNSSFMPIGHCALDWHDYLDDESLANKAEDRISVTTFFILKSRQGLGLGRVTMDLIEQKAEELGAKTITLNTIPSKYMKDPQFWLSRGLEYDYTTAPIAEEWYSRRGYREYKQAPRYPYKTLDGVEHIMACVFMSKPLS